MRGRVSEERQTMKGLISRVKSSVNLRTVVRDIDSRNVWEGILQRWN